MEEATAFAPCHITGFFEIFDNSVDALRVGSRGAGVSLDLGAETTVKVKKGSKYSLKVSINHHPADFCQVSGRVVDAFLSRFSDKAHFEVSVEHLIEAPVGAGFGTSGAGALSLALALNEALGLGISKLETAQIAHIAEVECKTGLGTVIAETFGGFEVRVSPGAPGIGEIKCLPLPDDTVVACHVFGALSTREALTNSETRARINRFGGELVGELVNTPTVMNFMKLSRQFAEHVGLITEKVRRILAATDKAGIICSMPMFGESAFTVTDENGVEPILRVFRENAPTGHTFASKLNHEGARLLQ
ncbi:MAG TPA: GHMP kinase [candidate division Zixibacteria bacterium]|nr:GHMP kinase [candidate division Zixibacteria bacterium]